MRASGRGLAPLVQALFGRALAPRVATLLPFTDAGGATLDRGLTALERNAGPKLVTEWICAEI